MDRIPFGCTQLDRLLGGGIEAGSVTLFYGEAGAGKPAPDIYLKVADRLGASPADCLVFEDTPSGIQAGIRAGSRVCAMEDRYVADQKDTVLRLADYYIHDFGQVLNGTYRRLKQH